MISDLGVVVPFRSDSQMLREAEDAVTEQQLEQQLNACILVPTIAELLYQARCYWIGGGALSWRELSPEQKRQYREEVERLIKEHK